MFRLLTASAGGGGGVLLGIVGRGEPPSSPNLDPIHRWSARKAVLPDRRSRKHVLFSAFFQPVPSAVVKHDSLRNLAEK